MKVMHLLQSGHFSGAENVVCQIYDMFSDSKDIRMFYVSREGDVKDIIEEKGIPYLGLQKFNIANIRMAIKKINPDIIHAHDISASVLVAICAPKKCKVISHVHVNNGNMSKVTIKTLIYITMCHRFSKIFWVSQSCFDGFVFNKRISNISIVLCNVMNKSNIEAKMHQDNHDYTYDTVYVGRITYQKNPEKLIEVLKILKSINPTIKVAVIGSGDKYNYVENQIGINNLGDMVDLLGFMKNPLKVLGDSKAMIMTSRYEGLPMTVLEAMALGIPIVSTPVDGLKDVVLNGENGYLCDDAEDLARNLNELSVNEKLQKQMSKRAIEIFNEKMNLTDYKREIEKAYRY